MGYKDFEITTIKEGYGKGTFRIVGYGTKTGKMRIFPSGGLLKTERRAKNFLNKIKTKYE